MGKVTFRHTCPSCGQEWVQKDGAIRTKKKGFTEPKKNTAKCKGCGYVKQF